MPQAHFSMHADDSEPEPPAEPSKPVSVSILNEAPDMRPEAVSWLQVHADRAVNTIDRGGEVRVRIVGDDAMSALHAKYKDDPETTDVLTFDLADGASVGGADLDVDLIVCADEAARRGAELGHTPECELLLYVVHGLMHCLGHDDQDPSAADAMHRAEDDLLESIGVGRVYAPRAASGLAPSMASDDSGTAEERVK